MHNSVMVAGFILRPSRPSDGNFVSWEFIGDSSPRATVEGARRLPESLDDSEMAAGSL
jgi:hypothetical protein